MDFNSGRPFTWGGPEWKFASILEELYGINSFEESTERIVKAVKSAGYETIIFLGHNGPSGLGDRPEDPCGRDWHPIGGDFGDPDLEEAISQSLTDGKVIPLVTFGHMHHSLRHSKKIQRKALFKSPEGIIYLNAATVPRIINQDGEKQRSFAIVTLEARQVTEVALIWVGEDFRVTSEQVLYSL